MVVGLTYGKRVMRQSVRSVTTAGARRFVRVTLLDREHIDIPVETKSKAREVFNQVCGRLGLREVEYFGLTQFQDGEHHFIDLDTKIQKINPKAWKSHNHTSGVPVITFYFRVQFYVDHVMVLRERITRQLYYLQLKDNLLHYNQLCTEEKCFLLAGYALQADHGTFNPTMEGHQYFDPREYFPAWVINKRGEEYIRRNMPSFHRDLGSLTKIEAQMRFIKDISAPPTGHNLHFYRLKKRKNDQLGTAWLGICPKGIEIYDELDNFKSVLSTFLWPEIGKLYFEKKKFEIRAVGGQESRKVTYYTGSDERSKYLLWLCRHSHMFQMTLQPKMAEIRHLEEADKRQFKESYIYSDTSDLESNRSKLSSFRTPNGLTSMASGSILEQRVSLYSNTSSNTTSGIVSDKMFSFDESEDDRSMGEIMIDSPPGPGHGSFRSPALSTSSILSYKTPLGSHNGSFKSAQDSLSFKSPADSLSSFPSPVVKATSASVSRSSSSTSNKSAKLSLLGESPTAKVLPNLVPAEVQVVTDRGPTIQVQRGQPAQFTQQVANPLVPRSPDTAALQRLPVPAGAQIQRVNMASPIMTVSSTRLLPSASNSPIPVTSTNPALPSVSNNMNIMSPMHPGYVNYKPPQTVMSSTPKPGVSMGTQFAYSSPTPVPPGVSPVNVTQAGYNGSLYGLVGHCSPALPAAGQSRKAVTTSQPVQYIATSHPTSSYEPPPFTPAIVARPIEHFSPVAVVRPLNEQAVNMSRPLNEHQFNVVVDVHAPSPPAALTVLPPTTTGSPNTSDPMPYGSPVYPGALDPTSFHDSPPAYKPPPPPVTAAYQQAVPITTVPVATSYQQPAGMQANSYQNHQPLIQASSYQSPLTMANYQTTVPSYQPVVTSYPAAVPSYQTPVTSYQAPAPLYQPISTVSVVEPYLSTGSQGAIPKIVSQELHPSTSSSPDPPMLLPATVATTSTSSTSNRLAVLPEAKAVRHNSWGQHEKMLGETARRARNRRHKTCPVHDIKPDVVEELRGLTNKNLSLPLLTALFNDSSLMSCDKNCNCEDSAHHDELHEAKLKRLSVNLSPVNTILNEPGTMIRPMSWHCDTFNLDQKLYEFNTLHIDESMLRKDPDYQNLPPVMNNGYVAASSPSSSTSHMINGVAPQSSSTSLSGSLQGLSVVPRKISSGGHSPNSTETLHQHPNIGIA